MQSRCSATRAPAAPWHAGEDPDAFAAAHPFEPHLVDIIERDVLYKNPDIKFNDIAGLHEAKALLQEAVVAGTRLAPLARAADTPTEGLKRTRFEEGAPSMESS